MSRAHPIGLRIASKKLNPPFIGVGQYYSYNQLKCNIVISKNIKQLSKQLAVPAYQIIDRYYSEKKNAKNQILYPNLFPMSVRLKAKQLFDSQCVLNKRRLYSVAIYITRLLKQQFEKNYNDFTKNTYSKPFSSITKHKPSRQNLPLTSLSKYQKWKFKKLKFCSICPSITFARAFFRVSKKPSLSLYDIKRNLNTLSTLHPLKEIKGRDQKIYKKEKKVKLLQQIKQNENLRFLLPIKNSDPYLILSYGVPFFGLLRYPKKGFLGNAAQLKEFYFLTKKMSININGESNFYPTPGDECPLSPLGDEGLVKNNCNLLIAKQALTLNCSWTPVFTLKKLKSKNSITKKLAFWTKTNHPVSTFALHLGKNENLNLLDQEVANIKKHLVNNLTSTKQPFYTFFFQYLTYIKQYGANTFTTCPEWPLSICFSPRTCSIYINRSTENYRPRLTAIYFTTKENKYKAKKQGKHVYLKTKKKDFSPSFQLPEGFFFLRVKIVAKQLPIAIAKNQRRDWVLSRYSKPTISYQNIKRFILLNYLSQLSPVNCALYQKPKFKTNHGPTVKTSLALAKEVRNRQKRLYLNSVLINKEEVLFLSTQHAHKISYTFCPRSSDTILNLKSIKKLTKQIEHFRSDIKLLAPLGLLLHRSFSEPVGINCISAMDNRLGKTYCNQFLKNLLFRRTSNNFLKSNYMSSQIGLLRAKNTILFDFAYTKDSLIKLGLKKTNTLMQQLLETGHTTLWSRKLSSIRL
jgi:hypothetical protein